MNVRCLALSQDTRFLEQYSQKCWRDNHIAELNVCNILPRSPPLFCRDGLEIRGFIHPRLLIVSGIPANFVAHV